MQLQIRENAKLDLIILYEDGYYKHGQEQAEKYYYEIIEKINNLVNSPYIAQFHKNIGYRVKIYKSHKIYYTIDNDIIIIVRILHYSQDEKLHLENINFDEI